MEQQESLRITPKWITSLQKDEIFVFGSNINGMHGGGAARVAMDKFGAIWGQGEGLQGQSYAIPTVEGLANIPPVVDRFIAFAKDHPELKFFVTPIGCGIAGYTEDEIAPLFKEATKLDNVFLPTGFWQILGQ